MVKTSTSKATPPISAAGIHKLPSLWVHLVILNHARYGTSIFLYRLAQASATTTFARNPMALTSSPLVARLRLLPMMPGLDLAHQSFLVHAIDNLSK